jgi:hypothetical protein
MKMLERQWSASRACLTRAHVMSGDSCWAAIRAHCVYLFDARGYPAWFSERVESCCKTAEDGP